MAIPCSHARFPNSKDPIYATREGDTHEPEGNPHIESGIHDIMHTDRNGRDLTAISYSMAKLVL